MERVGATMLVIVSLVRNVRDDPQGRLVQLDVGRNRDSRQIL